MTAFFKEIEPFRGNGNENEKGQTLEEFLEEYGGIIAISVMGYAVMSGLWDILRMICETGG